MPNNTYNSTANTSWTCPKNAIYVVECWGGGGGGASYGRTSAAHGSNGGGGGAYAKSTVTCVKDTVYTIGIGNGGAGSTTNNANGVNGTNSQFNNSAVRASFGGRGLVAGSTPGVAGTVANCVYNVIAYAGGNAATYALMVAGGGGAGGGNTAKGNNAIGSAGGIGGGGGSTGGAGGASNTSGSPSSTRAGGGGGGAGGNLGTTIKAGGNGNNGQIIITWNDWILGSADTTQANAPCTGTLIGKGSLAGSSDTLEANANVTGHLSAHMPISGVSNGSCTPACSGTLVPPFSTEYIAGVIGQTLSDDFQSYSTGALNGQGNWLNNSVTANSMYIGDTAGDKRFYSYGTTTENCARRSESFNANQFAQCTLDAAPNDPTGVSLRCSYTGGVYYHFGYYCREYSREVFYSVNGSYTELGGSGGPGVSAGDVLRIELTGNILKVYLNGVIDTVLSGGGIYDVSSVISSYPALGSGAVGVTGFDNDTVGCGDDWTAGEIGCWVSGTLTAKGSLHGATGIGASLLDSGKGDFTTDTEGFVAYGSNTIALENGALRVNYVDNNQGAYNYLNAAGDLTTDLTVGLAYRIVGKIKVNTGGVWFMAYRSGMKGQVWVANTEYAWKSLSFVCDDTVNTDVGFGDFESGEIIWLDKYSISQIIGATVSGTLTPKAYLSGTIFQTITDNFNSYTTGDLDDQGLWRKVESPQINILDDSGNKVIYPGTGGDAGYAYDKQVNPNQWAQIIVGSSVANDYVGIALRCGANDSEEFYKAIFNSGYGTMERNYAGGYAALDTYSDGVVTDDVIRFEIWGNQLKCYLNGVLVMEATDSNFTTGRIGISAYRDTGQTYGDNWTGGELVCQVTGTLGTAAAGGAIAGVSNGVATVSGTLVGKGTLSGKVDPYLTDDFQAYTEGPLNGQGNWVNNCPSSNGIAVKDTGGDKRFCANVAAEVCARRTETVGNDQFAEFTVDSNINVSGAAVRCSYTSSVYYYFGYYGDSGQKAVFYSVGGSFSTIQYVGGGWTNGDVVRLEIVGNTLKCYRNGVLDPTLTGVYDVSSIIATYSALASGSVGVSGADHADTAGRGDDWRGGALVVSGALKGKGTLAGSTNGVADVSGTLVLPAGVLAGTIDGVATVSGLMQFTLLGSSSGVSDVSGILIGKGNLVGQTNGTCSPANSGTLVGEVSLSGTTDGVADVSGTVIGLSAGSLYGITNGVASVTGLAFINLLGTSSGVASCSATLVGKGAMKGNTGVGASLMDSGKGTFDSGTEGWVAYGTNIITNDAGALKIEFGSLGNQYGAYVYLRESSDLSQDLVVGKRYEIIARVKVNVGTTIYWQFLSSTATAEIICQNTDWAWIQLQLIALVSTTNTFRLRGLGTGEITWLDEYTVWELLGSSLSGILKGKGILSGSINGVANVSGTLHGHCYPIGVANGIASCSATLVGHCHPVGTTSGVADVSGSLHGHGKLYGTINGVASCSGRPVQLTMIGQTDGIATVTGLMFFRFHGTINGIASCSATLVGKGQRAGIINSVATVSGILKGHAPKAGIINGTTSCSALLHGYGKLYGIINGVESTVGVLKGEGILTGTIDGGSLLSGLLGGVGTLIGLLGGVTVTAAELIGWGILTGEIDGVTLLTGDLSERQPGKCDGIINGVTSVSGTLPGWGDLKGVSAGTALVQGLYTPLYVGEELLEPSLITTEIFEQSLITTELAYKSLITEEIGDELGGIALITFINITNLGVVSSTTLDQTDIIRTILEAGYTLPIRFPTGTYRCRNLYIQQNGQHVIIDGTIKNIDGTLFTVTQDALEGQNIIYIEDATGSQLDYLEMLINEAPNYYYYVSFFDELYTIEGGGTDQIHHNAWVSRLTGVNKTSKYITIKDNIPVMPNYCGGTLHVTNGAVVTVLYNVFEVNECINPQFSGSGTVDANRYNFVDLNPVWISGEEGHPEFAGSGGNFIECFSVRFGYGFEMTGDIKLRDGKDNIIVWYMDGSIHLDGVNSYNAHNKNIAYIICPEEDYPDIVGLFENLEADGSDYEDGFIGYTSSDNLTIRNCVARNCPRYGFSWNRWTSHNNYAENLEAYNCGNSFSCNRGGITDVLTLRNLYYEGGGRHDKSGDYQSGMELRSQTAIIGGYEDIYNLGFITDKQTYGILVMFNRNINLIWEVTAPAKNKLCVGNLTPPHSYGYWLRITSTSYNIVVDGGGVLEVNNFKYLFWIETGSTGIVIKNCRFNSYTNLGTIDASATFENNYFNGVLYASGYPGTSVELMRCFDAALGVSRSGEDVSVWDDKSAYDDDALQGTTDLMPHWIDAQVNGLPVIKGDGINDILTLEAGVLISGDFAMFAVIGGVTGPGHMCGYSSTVYTRYLQNSTIWRNSTTHTFDHSNVPLTTGYFLHHIVRRSGEVRSYRNSVESLTGVVTNSSQYGLRYLFSYGTIYGSGAKAEFRLYQGTLSESDEEFILNELNTKYELY
jgi:hypothetical protein